MLAEKEQKSSAAAEQIQISCHMCIQNEKFKQQKIQAAVCYT
jgi:hypothetical protein